MNTLRVRSNEKFFVWKKILVRSTHLFIVLFITSSLFIRDTELRQALTMRHYYYFVPYVVMVYLSLLFYFLTCLTSPGYVKRNNRLPGTSSIKNDRKSGINSSTTSSFSDDDLTSSQNKKNRVKLVDLKAPNTSRTVKVPAASGRITLSDDYSSAPETESHASIQLPKIKRRFCEFCQSDQPIRSRHCEECDRCIRKFDHHCPWLETCIGEKNHGYFWIFLLVTNVLIVWTIIIITRAFIYNKLWSIWLLRNFFYLVCMHILVVALLVCAALFLIHTYFMFNNTTTWERFSRKNITYLKVINDEKLNPFNENYCRNMMNFFACGFASSTSAKSPAERVIDEERRWENVYVRYMKTKIDSFKGKSTSARPADNVLSSDESSSATATVLDMNEMSSFSRVNASTKTQTGQNPSDKKQLITESVSE